MEASIKDKDRQVFAALRALGYNVTNRDVEKFLNVADFIRGREGKADPTIREIILLGETVDQLYKE